MIEEIKRSEKWGTLRLEWCSLTLGAWNYANTRGYWRIVASPYTDVPAISRLRPGEVVLHETWQVTRDYPGGYYGYERAWEEISHFWRKCKKAYVKILKQLY